jgi:ribose 5-phosphate isomerase B
MNIAIASDHAGFRYKERIAAHLREKGHQVRDFGTDSTDPVDYPEFVGAAARAVANEECDRGIVLGGSGNGEAMVANRYKGVRCALCWNVESARLARSHNDANVLALGERLLTEVLALEIVGVWLKTEFEGGRHQRRIEQIDQVA